MTLEWLLIVAAIAGLAASSVLAVQKVVDNSTDRPPRPEVLIVDAEIAAAFIAHEATEAERANPSLYVHADFEQRCVIDLANRFSKAVVRAVWTAPVDSSSVPPRPAKCTLTRVST